MNDKQQIGTLKNALRKKYSEATTDLNRKKIKFIASAITALMNEQNPPQGKLRSTT